MQKHHWKTEYYLIMVLPSVSPRIYNTKSELSVPAHSLYTYMIHQPCCTVAVLYRMVGNFHGVLIFVIFVVDLAVTKINHYYM